MTVVEVIKSHRCSNGIWCETCKSLVVDPAQHIVDMIIAAGFTISGE